MSNSSHPFIAEDLTTGAEVSVQKVVNATVDRIEDNDKSSKVSLKLDHLKHPITGYVGKDDPILQIVRDAQANNETVSARVEVSRKNDNDVTTPISELKENNPTANLIRLLVQVNDVVGLEIKTDPNVDPGTPGFAEKRRNELNQNSGGGTGYSKEAVLEVLSNAGLNTKAVPEEVVHALRAQALLAGASFEEISDALNAHAANNEAPQYDGGGSSVEAPPFKSYNNNGHFNFGSYEAGASFNIYTYVYAGMTKQVGSEPDDHAVVSITRLLLASADLFQQRLYGPSFRVDRSTQSHTKARSAIFTYLDALPIENRFPLTAGGQLLPYADISAWITNVGKKTRNIMENGFSFVNVHETVKNVLDHLNGESETVQAPPVPETPAAAPEARPEPVQATPEQPAAVAAQPEPAETPAQAEYEPAEGDYEMFPQKILPPGAMSSETKASDELIEQFKEFVTDELALKDQSELLKVGHLLAYTFGPTYSKASRVPEEELSDFLDFYVATGAENTLKVLDVVSGLPIK